MPERDWQKDWERCEQATPGRWEVEGAGGAHMNGTRDGYNVCVYGKRLNNPWFSYEDASFITTAHEALPYWLQRYRELHDKWIADAEEKIRLRYRLTQLEAQVAVMRNILSEFTDPNNTVWPFRNGEADVGQYNGYFRALERAEQVLSSLDVGEELLEENRRLKAVAEAAKWVRETWVNKRVSFTVPGRPVPAARMTRRGKWTSRAKRSLAYQEAVAWAAKAARVPMLSGPVCLTAKIYIYGRRRGDLSNYLKALEDGLQYAGVIPNDKQIIRYGGQTGIYAAARREDERAEIVLEEVQWAEVGMDAAAT